MWYGHGLQFTGELVICETLGIKGEDIMFTSNNTSLEECRKALEMRAIINFPKLTTSKKRWKVPCLKSYHFASIQVQITTLNITSALVTQLKRNLE